MHKIFFWNGQFGTSNFMGAGAEPEKKRTAPQQYKFDTAEEKEIAVQIPTLSKID